MGVSLWWVQFLFSLFIDHSVSKLGDHPAWCCDTEGAAEAAQTEPRAAARPERAGQPWVRQDAACAAARSLGNPQPRWEQKAGIGVVLVVRATWTARRGQVAPPEELGFGMTALQEEEGRFRQREQLGQRPAGGRTAETVPGLHLPHQNTVWGTALF